MKTVVQPDFPFGYFGTVRARCFSCRPLTSGYEVLVSILSLSFFFGGGGGFPFPPPFFLPPIRPEPKLPKLGHKNET